MKAMQRSEQVFRRVFGYIGLEIQGHSILIRPPDLKPASHEETPAQAPATHHHMIPDARAPSRGQLHERFGLGRVLVATKIHNT
jgi:hypothetical protein